MSINMQWMYAHFRNLFDVNSDVFNNNGNNIHLKNLLNFNYNYKTLNHISVVYYCMFFLQNELYLLILPTFQSMSVCNTLCGILNSFQTLLLVKSVVWCMLVQLICNMEHTWKRGIKFTSQPPVYRIKKKKKKYWLNWKITTRNCPFITNLCINHLLWIVSHFPFYSSIKTYQQLKHFDALLGPIWDKKKYPTNRTWNQISFHQKKKKYFKEIKHIFLLIDFIFLQRIPLILLSSLRLVFVRVCVKCTWSHLVFKVANINFNNNKDN